MHFVILFLSLCLIGCGCVNEFKIFDAKEDLALLKWSSRSLVNRFRNLLGGIMNRSFEVNYLFKHNALSSNEQHTLNAGKTEPLVDCRGVYSRACRYFVHRQIDLRFKHYDNFFETIFQYAIVFTNMSAFSTYSLLSAQINDLFYQQSLIDSYDTATRLEMGGGSGFGFQLYCNNQSVLTAGGGGGGGLEGVYNKDKLHKFNHNYGGGSGGGMQIDIRQVCAHISSHNINSRICKLWYTDKKRFNNDGLISIGGGGGCGTIDEDSYDSSSAGMLCGMKIDPDFELFLLRNKLSEDDVRVFIKSMWHHLSSCEDIRVQGGGGGGGGTAECCQPYMIGYGFNFTLTSSPPTAHISGCMQDSYGDQSTQYDTLEDMENTDVNADDEDEDRDQHPAGNSNAFDSFRYEHDMAGYLFHQTSLLCGGYSNWYCVCTHAKYILKTCVPKSSSRSHDSQENLQRQRQSTHEHSHTSEALRLVCSQLKKRGVTSIMWIANMQCDTTQLSRRLLLTVREANLTAVAKQERNKLSKSQVSRRLDNRESRTNQNLSSGRATKTAIDSDSVSMFISDTSVWCSLMSSASFSVIPCLDAQYTDIIPAIPSEVISNNISSIISELLLFRDILATCLATDYENVKEGSNVACERTKSSSQSLIESIHDRDQLCSVLSLITPSLNLFYTCRLRRGRRGDEMHDQEVQSYYILLMSRYKYFTALWQNACIKRDASEQQSSHLQNAVVVAMKATKKSVSEEVLVLGANHTRAHAPAYTPSSHTRTTHDRGPCVSMVFFVCYMIVVSATLQLLTRRYLPYLPLQSQYYDTAIYYNDEEGN